MCGGACACRVGRAPNRTRKLARAVHRRLYARAGTFYLTLYSYRTAQAVGQYNARSVRKAHNLPRMPFIAQLTELIASCKPTGAYGLVPEMFARALADVRSAPSMPYAGDLGPNQWWRAIPSVNAQQPPASGSTYHAPPSMPIAGPSHQYRHAYPQHYARSLSPQPPPPPPSHGRKRTASAAQLDPRPEPSTSGRDKFKFEMWTGGQRAGSSSGQSAGAGASGSRAPAKYARYNPDEPGPPKGYELCTDVSVSGSMLCGMGLLGYRPSGSRRRIFGSGFGWHRAGGGREPQPLAVGMVPGREMSLGGRSCVAGSTSAMGGPSSSSPVHAKSAL